MTASLHGFRVVNFWVIFAMVSFWVTYITPSWTAVSKLIKGGKFACWPFTRNSASTLRPVGNTACFGMESTGEGKGS